MIDARTSDRDHLAALAAQMYYAHDRPTQQKIARELKVDKATVSRLLKHARDKGLVEISFRLPRDKALELELLRKYGLQNAAVFPVLPPTKDIYPAYRSALAQSAARYLENESELLSSGQHVGISCGSTLKELIESLTPHKYDKMRLTQLTVETESSWHLDCAPFTLVGMACGKWVLDRAPDPEGHSKEEPPAYAVQPMPGTLRTLADWSASYKTCREIILRRAASLDVALLGVGHLEDKSESGTYFRMMVRRGIKLKNFLSLGVIGEICNRVFDAQGRDVSDQVPRLNEFVDGLEIDRLQSLATSGRRVIAIAGGMRKAKAIHVALKTRMVNNLITDVDAAQRLCAM